MATFSEFEQCLIEYFTGLGLEQIDKYASSGSIGRPLSFQIDYRGHVWGRFKNRCFSLWADPQKNLQYVYTIYHDRRNRTFDKDLVVSEMINNDDHILIRCRIDFHDPNSFNTMIGLLMEAEKNSVVDIVLPPKRGVDY